MCMGKTCLRCRCHRQSQEHPHVYGEDEISRSSLLVFVRNTPMCMGKTIDPPDSDARMEEHPHVYGEDNGNCIKIGRQ